jgi:methanogenic corrinoid protein MtbC1
MGRSIGSVASLPPEAAEALLSEDLEATPVGDPSPQAEERGVWVDDAYRAMVQMDTESLERTLWRAFLALGAKGFLDGVAAPLLERVGNAWAAGRVSPAQEHLGSGVLERVLTWMNDPSMSAEDGPVVVVATLPGERHALGARLAAAAAAIEGWRPTYLGADLPVEEIATAASNVGAKRVAISAVQTDQVRETEQTLIALRELLDPDIEVIVGGAAARLLRRNRLPSGIGVFEGLDGFAAPGDNGRGA